MRQKQQHLLSKIYGTCLEKQLYSLRSLSRILPRAKSKQNNLYMQNSLQKALKSFIETCHAMYNC